MPTKYLPNVKWLLFLFLIPQSSWAQTSVFENAVLKVFFPVFIDELNSHLRPTLSDKERRILKLVKVNLEYGGTNNYNINSESGTRTITISSNLIKGLVRYSVAQVIGEDKLQFSRNRFGEFYLSIYPYLSPDVSPEDAAELSNSEKLVLDRICRTPGFQWFLKQKLQFLYLHELAHQFNNYDKQTSAIGRAKKSSAQKKEALLKLEMDADQYAIDKGFQMGLDAREYGEGLDFLQVIREQKYATSEDVARREINFFSYLAFGFKCQKQPPTDTLCMGLAKREADYLRLYKNLVYLHNNKNRFRLADSAINNNDIYLLYNLGDFYLKGSNHIVAHLDSSLYYFRKGGNLAFKTNGNSGFTQKQFEESREYCLFLAGKIYELQKKDIANALDCYRKAESLSHLFPKEYYSSLIYRVVKLN